MGKGVRPALGYAGSSYTTSTRESGHEQQIDNREQRQRRSPLHTGALRNWERAGFETHNVSSERRVAHDFTAGIAGTGEGSSPDFRDVQSAPFEQTRIGESLSINLISAHPSQECFRHVAACSASNRSRRDFLTPVYKLEARYSRRDFSFCTDSGMGPPKRYRCSAMSHLLGGLLTQVSPVNIWSQFFAANCTGRFPFKVDTQALAQALPPADGLSKVALRCCAARHIAMTVSLGQAVEVGEEFVHVEHYYRSVISVQHFLVIYPLVIEN